MKKRREPSLSRKEQRKKDRKDKKAKKHTFFSKKKIKNQPIVTNNNVTEKFNSFEKSNLKTKGKVKNLKSNISLQDEQLKEVNKLRNDSKNLETEMRKKRVKQLKLDAVSDDAEIKKLEKLLGLNKRKEKTKINSFAVDGLDFLLDVCDKTKLTETMEAESRFKEDGDDDFGEDLAMVTGKKVKKKKAKKTEKKEEESDSEPEEMVSTKAGALAGLKKPKKVESDSEEIESDDVDKSDSDDFGLNADDGDTDIEEDSDEMSDEEEIELPKENKRKAAKFSGESPAKKPKLTESEEEESGNSEDDLGSDIAEDDDVSKEDGEEGKEDGTWEDIYGRTRDKEGNVVGKYQPPHMRKILAGEGQNSEKLGRLKKQMKGLMNRLAENNMVSIASQIEQLYGNNSRNDMNETLWALLKESLISETSSPERLVAEHAMLLAILSANVGGEVSAHCLQKFVTFWHELWSAGDNQVQDKRTNNILLLLSYMFLFKLFHCTLLYDILEQLIEKVGEKEVELILLVLRSVGLHLRKEDPVRLKDFVVKAQTMANKNENASEGTRIKFLLDTILAIKNNNMSKIPNYNPELGDSLKKSLRACVRQGNYNAELKVTLEDLLKADVRGRWWVVGSAWTGELPGEKDGSAEKTKKDGKKKKSEEGFSSQLLELAKKQRMNTDIRRTVFCVLMSAEDYLDAFEKLLKLGLKGPSEREIMNVMLHCLLQEKQYNPYYEHLARRFCTADRRFQVMLQFATWDKIQVLKTLSPSQVSNLAKFLGRLILEKNLAISVLKVIEFGELDKAGVRFVRQVVLGILLADSEESLIAAFGRIAGSKPLKLFREGLRLFLHHFVLRNSKDVEGMNMALLTTRVKLADSALSAADRNIAF